ncbi:hypothetical protein acsn021_42670 [Anaerocolumna cellulosilytica]|uniref:Uncharacterized protein n=1 Tax=Anaerocolumna cellulosilytica TaxID=433286 RepID=A0A6S6RD15_9FIRM|nr:hypothetical protein [Anaerocolumna cellulosilytica]MBB5195225.1 hypothetical protein [Anaerocolumna cellulosilytica]BCJ96698.1 hypothetical protein acsn021_42670 [Anaerocolumna cellulosilytica]
MKLKYPIESFALLFVIASDTLRNSLVFGSLFLVLLLCGFVIRDFCEPINTPLIQKLILWISLPSLTYVLFNLVYFYILKEELTPQNILLLLITGGYMAMFYAAGLKDTFLETVPPEITETKDTLWDVLKENLVAYSIFIAAGAVREFLSKGGLLGYTFIDSFFITNTFESLIAGFLFAGIGLSLVHYIINKGCTSRHNSLWVVLPVVLLYQPFTIENINEVISFLLSTTVSVLFIISVQKRLIFSCTSQGIKKIPIELVSMGFIYMILKAF